MFHLIQLGMPIELFLQVKIPISYLVTMGNHIHMPFIKNGHKYYFWIYKKL